MDYNTLLIDALRAKQYITPLEKDILDTWNELQKHPFDMNSAEQQVVSNVINHPKIAVMIIAITAIAAAQTVASRNHSCSIRSHIKARTIPDKTSFLINFINFRNI